MWRISNAILAVFMATAFTAFLLRARNARLANSQKIMPVFATVVLLSLCLSAMNAVSAHQLTFILGLWFGLITGVHNFALLLFRIERKQ